MVRCPNQYGGSDEFANYNDCHVWVPFILAANLLNLGMAIFNMIYGVKRLAIAPTYLSKFTCLGSALLIFYYVGRIATGYVLGDRVFLLNLAHALGYGCLWLVCIRFALQYLNSLLENQKIKAKTEAIVPRANLVFKIFMAFAFISEVLVLTLPSASDSFYVFPTYYIFNLLRIIIILAIFSYFALIARDLFNATDNQKYAARVRRKLNHVLYPGLGGTLVALILNVLAISVPGMKNNQYAMTPLMYATTMQICAFVILVLSKKKAYRDQTLLDEHQSEQRRSDSKKIDRKGSYTKTSTFTPSTPSHGEGRLDLSTSTPYKPHHHHANIIQSQHLQNHSNSNLLSASTNKDSSETYVQNSRRLTVPDEPSIITSEVSRVSRGDDSIPEESKMDVSKSAGGTPIGGPNSSVSVKNTSPGNTNHSSAIILPSPPEADPEDQAIQQDRPPALEKDKDHEHHDVWVQ